MKKLFIYPLAAALLALFAASPGAAEKADADAKALFEQKCSKCHSIERPTSKKKTPEQWKSTVTRMQNKAGAGITDEEAATITDYLSKNYGA